MVIYDDQDMYKVTTNKLITRKLFKLLYTRRTRFMKNQLQTQQDDKR